MKYYASNGGITRPIKSRTLKGAKEECSDAFYPSQRVVIYSAEDDVPLVYREQGTGEWKRAHWVLRKHKK